MRGIVATIQAEQGEIIRLDHPEVPVIEGGPGTGKTVVALHRVILLGVLSRLTKQGCQRFPRLDGREDHTL
jgi:DNA helicase IV